MGDSMTCRADTFAPQYNYGTFSGYGVSVDHGTQAEAINDATACAQQLTRETQAPYQVQKGMPNAAYPQMGYYTVEKFTACTPDATFQSWFTSTNASDAKACTEALNAIAETTTPSYFYVAKRVPGIFADSWKIIETVE